MKGKLIRSIFWALVAVFILVVGVIFVPALNELSARVAPFGLIFLGVLFFLLGVTLIVLTVKHKVQGKLKRFLLLTGSSAAGLPVFAILSNVVYALVIYFFGENAWGSVGDEPFFFILATIVCPIAFLVGAVGTIVLGAKNKSNADQAIEGGKP
jgi:divalent metal cation (Fe/Co/Zn/Cd) transporter